jgi:hypothetical protein
MKKYFNGKKHPKLERGEERKNIFYYGFSGKRSKFSLISICLLYSLFRKNKMKLFSVLLIIPFLLQAQQIHFPQDTLAYDNLFNNRQFAVYDSEGRTHLTYTGQSGTDGATREIYYLSERSNGTFEKINITNNSVDDNYSTLSIDQNGNLHVGLTGRDGTNLFQIKYTNNISGSFFPPMWITTGGLNKATPFSKIGPDSVMHFVYFTYTDGSDNAYYRTYDLRNSTLSNEIFLTQAEAGGDYEASLDVDAIGKVHIVVKSGGIFGGPLKYFSNKTGNLQEIITPVSGNITLPRIRIHNGVVHLLYRLESGTRLHYTNNSSGDFSTPIPITPVGQRPAGYQNFTTDDEGNLYFVYQSSVAASGKGFFLIFGHNSGTFTDSMLVYDLTPEYVTRNSSMVIARGNGNFSVFYAPGAVRNSIVICDIFRKKGNIFDIIPVELENFTAYSYGNAVELKWVTVSETNNYGFEVERNSGEGFVDVTFVPGSGTITEKRVYSFTEYGLQTGKHIYKLTQIDYDGSRSVIGTVEADVSYNPSEFVLSQNYPNPFNPSTVIRYQIPEDGFVTLKIYDLLGNELATLFEGEQNRGSYTANWDASGIASGVYFYTLITGNNSASKKLMLLR